MSSLITASYNINILLTYIFVLACGVTSNAADRDMRHEKRLSKRLIDDLLSQSDSTGFYLILLKQNS